MTHLNKAYELGVQQAQDVFQKQAADWQETLAPILGALPLVGPPAAGMAAQGTAPQAGLAATTGSAFGQALGGLGGAALGAGLGAGGTALAKHLGADIDIEPGQAAQIGALLGGGLGMAGGGAYGARKGQVTAKEVGEEQAQLADAMQQMALQERQQRMRQTLNNIIQAHQMGVAGQGLRLRANPETAAKLRELLAAQQG